MKKTKWLAACIAACALALVAGCSSGDDGGSELPGIEYDAAKWVIEGTTVVRYTGAEADVRIPDGVTIIGESAFKGCKSLKSVTIPASVTSIEDGAFDECGGFAVTYGGTLAQWCQMDNDWALLDNAKSIKLSDGTDLKSLTTLEIPSGVTKIGAYAFDSCTSLASVTIPASVESIGESAFEDCTSLASVTIPGSVKSIGWLAFGGCKSLASVEIPGSVKSIGMQAFVACESRASVTIGDGVTSIGEWAFTNCKSLASVEIPASVESIGWLAFGGFTSLEEVKYGGTAEQWKKIDIGSDAFPSGVKIYDKEGKEIEE